VHSGNAVKAHLENWECLLQEGIVGHLATRIEESLAVVTNPVTMTEAEQEGGKMFELILGVVCLAVLVVEVIEVRQKCEESYPGMWHEAHAFDGPSASLTGVRDERSWES
jgi:hypothetical protein